MKVLVTVINPEGDKTSKMKRKKALEKILEHVANGGIVHKGPRKRSILLLPPTATAGTR
jgi:hypothetical protein